MTTRTIAKEYTRPSETVSRDKGLILLYVALTMIGTLSLFDTLPTALKLAYFPFLGIAVLLMIMGYEHKERLRYSKSFLLEYLVYVLMMFGITSVIYAFTRTPMPDMMRGYEKLGYQVLTVFITVAAYYLFGEQAIEYTFVGFVGFMLASIALALKQTGPSQAVGDFIYFLKSGGDAQGFMKYLELHDGIFAFGIFMIYYMQKGLRANWRQFAVAMVMFLLGFKRIGIIAFAAVAGCYVFLRKYRIDIKKFAKTAGFVWLAAGFGYIVLTHYDVLTRIAESVGIDTMGRTELYDFIRQYYRIDILFGGRGFEYITQLMKVAQFGTLNMAKIGAIHNGFLTIYIEFGMIGFFAWTGFWLIWHMGWISKYNEEVVLSYLLITIYLFITYLTDNTAFYFSTGIVARLVPMAFLEGGSADFEAGNTD